MADSRQNLIHELVRFARLPAGEPTREVLASLKEAFLAYGSETEDNVPAIAALKVIRDFRTWSLGIRGSAAPIDGIINHLESLPVPKELQVEFPDLDQQKWKYALRIVTLILAALSPER